MDTCIMDTSIMDTYILDTCIMVTFFFFQIFIWDSCDIHHEKSINSIENIVIRTPILAICHIDRER